MLATDNRYKILQTTPTCMTAINLHECMTAINLHECRLYLNSHLTPQVISVQRRVMLFQNFGMKLLDIKQYL